MGIRSANILANAVPNIPAPPRYRRQPRLGKYQFSSWWRLQSERFPVSIAAPVLSCFSTVVRAPMTELAKTTANYSIRGQCSPPKRK